MNFSGSGVDENGGLMPGGIVRAEAAWENPGLRERRICLLLAAYDNAGALTTAAYDGPHICGAYERIDISAELLTPTDAKEVKAFFWDADSLEPVAIPYTVY